MRYSVAVAAAVTFHAMLCQPARAQAQRPGDVALVRKIEAYIAPLAGDLSGTLLVARGDRVLYEKSFGFAHHELRVPFTPQTASNVASITKPLTIIITTRLVEAGKLSVNDTVSRWVPEYVHGGRMTVTQLLNHRAGVPHRLLREAEQSEPRTTADMVRAANALPLLFEPGTSTTYSSGGYAILAAVLERASGKSYDELLQEHVAQPVRAGTIRHVDRRQILAGRAVSVIPTGSGVVNTALRDLSFLVGGGSVYSTPRDIYRVMRGVELGMYGASARTALERPTGFVWNGVTNGYRAFADWHSKDSTFVVFAGNSHTGAIDLLRREIPRMARGEAVTAAEVPRVTAADISDAARARIMGEYDTGGGALAATTFLSPRLLLFGDRALIALNDSVFHSTSDYARITFTSDSTGAVNALRWGPGTWATSPDQSLTFPRARK